jgi:phosphate-selective porin OprO and OprP
MQYKTMSYVPALAVALISALYAPSGHADEGWTFENKGGLSMETVNGNFSFQVIGRIQADAAFYDDDVADLGSGTELRRARLGVQGTFLKHWGYKSEFDFAGENVTLADVYLQYLGFDPVVFTVGHFKQPFSLDNITSSNDITFMERALTYDAFTPPRRIGAGIGYGGENWSVNAGAFGETADEDAGDNPDGGEADSGISAAGRVTFDPILSDTHLLHVGASLYWRDPGRGETTELLTRPESHVTDVALVDTGAIANVDDVQTYGLEAATVQGLMHAEGEYMLSNVNTAAGDFDFDGWYIEGGYFLTGESRPYDPEEGKWTRVTPEGPYGAWEVAARYCTVDLNDGVIQGGMEDDVGVALNWYPNYYLRFSANYINVVDQERAGVSDEPNIFQVRAQLAF